MRAAENLGRFKHSWMKLETRYSRAATFVEGGPAHDHACAPGDPCRLWPGTDLFVPSICDGSEFELDWDVNRPAPPVAD